MGKGVGVPFVADVGPFLKGTGQVEDALGNVIDSLDEVAHQGRTTEQVISRSLDNTADDARTASGKLEGKFKEAFDSIVADSKTAANKVERHIDDVPDHVRTTGKGRFGEVGADLGGEFAQNIGEGISSGKVGIAGALDTVLGTVGGVLPALGPAGAVAGVGALVIGSVISGINASKDAAIKRAKEIGADLYTAMQDGVIDATEKESVLEKVLGVDNEADVLRKVKEFSDKTGLSVQEVYKIITGASSTTRADIEKTIAAHTTLVGGPSGGRAGGGARKQIDDIGLAYKDILGYQDDYNGGLSEGNTLIATQNGLLDKSIAKVEALNKKYERTNALNKIRANPSRYLTS